MTMLLLSCKSGRINNQCNSDTTKQNGGNKIAQGSKESICVYRYNGFSKIVTREAIAEIRKYYPNVEDIGALTLPEYARYSAKGCYTGTIVLNHLRRTRKSNVVIGFTDRDICYVNNGERHYRCMGLGRAKQAVAITTTSRFKSKRNLQMYFNRLTLHELGHAFGLEHCKNKDCIMVAAYGRNQFWHTPSFCPNCQKYLKAKNWKFNI